VLLLVIGSVSSLWGSRFEKFDAEGTAQRTLLYSPASEKSNTSPAFTAGCANAPSAASCAYECSPGVARYKCEFGKQANVETMFSLHTLKG
jgi:hypothetical protein